MGKGKLVVGLAAILIAGYVVASPLITVYQMKSAAEKNDGEALSEHIEFPSLRQSIKDQVNAMFVEKLENDKNLKGNAFAGLAMVFAGALVEKAVDVYVTPAGISKIMAGEMVSLGELGQSSEGKTKKEPFKNASFSYESTDKFVVTVANKSEEPVRFILRRQGLNWKLTDIRLPLN